MSAHWTAAATEAFRKGRLAGPVGDLINRNVLVGSGSIAAVFDWGCAFCGDFLYDVAWLEFWAPWHPGIASTDIRVDARDHFEQVGADTSDFAARMACCLIHIGLDHLAYHVYTGDRDALEEVVERLLAVTE